MSTKGKVSKFEKAALELVKEGENLEKQAERGYRKAVSKVNTQISQLEGKRVDYQDRIDDAADAVKRAKFSLEFNLSNYDNAVANLEELEIQLKAIEATIENRKQLLTSWE